MILNQDVIRSLGSAFLLFGSVIVLFGVWVVYSINKTKLSKKKK